MPYAYIHICKNETKANLIIAEHKTKNRETSLDEHDGVDIFDDRTENSDPPILTEEESKVYIVKAW